MTMWTKEQEAEALRKRFESLKKEIGVSRAAFARNNGLKGGDSMINQHITGHRPLSKEAAIAYAKGFGCTLRDISPRLASEVEELASFIEGESVRVDANPAALSPLANSQIQSQGSQSASMIVARHPDDALPDDMIEVMEYRVSFSAGNGHTPNYDLIEEREPATYRMSWFQRERINPEYARRFKVTGDSMEPFLYSGDTVLVNLAENDSTRIIDGKVYAIRYGDELRIKRLFRKLNGTLTLRSENPAYKDEDVDPEVAEEHITIIGRVRDKGGSGGL